MDVTKESLNIKADLLPNKPKEEQVNDNSHEQLTVVIGEPISDSVPEVKKTCCYRFRTAAGSIKSRYSYFSIVGYLTYLSIFACTSFCAFACVNSAFSIFSVNSVASVASVNSVLSIGSVNCFECVFNVPLVAITGRTSNTCNKYSLVDGAHEAKEKLLYGLPYQTVEAKVENLSEEELANDCCLFIHSTEAKKYNLKAFILNANRTACLVYGGKTGEGTLDRTDVDAAEYVYKPCPPGEVCL